MSTVENSAPVSNELTIEQIVANSPFAKPLTVTRNGVTQTLEVSVGKRGTWENKPYAHIVIAEDPQKDFMQDETFLSGIKYVGKSNVVRYMNVILRRAGQDAVVNATDEVTGVFDMTAFLKECEELAASDLKISELKELLDAEQKKHEDFVANDFMKIFESGDVNAIAAAKKTIEERTASIKSLRFQLEKRSQKKSKEVNVDTTRPE